MNVGFAVAGAVIGAVSSVYYIGTILRGGSRPHRISWFAWTVVTGLGAVVTVEAGAGVGSLVVIRAAVATALVFALSLIPRFGKPDAERPIDGLLGLVCLVAIIVWQVAGLSVVFAAAVAVFTDALISVPTIREAWRQPEHESAIAWGSSLVGQLLGLLAIERPTFSSAGYLACIAAVNTCVVAALVVARRRRASIVPEKVVTQLTG